MLLGRIMTSITLLSVVVLGLCACLSLGAVAGQTESKKPVVVLDTSSGAITLELDPEKAPITVANFLKYVDSGFYDNLIFHRVMPGFMVQGGGMDDKMDEKRTDKENKPLVPIKNESRNGLSNERGSIAMARTSDPNSATCQFFINHADNARLDTLGGGYAVFGKVIDGMDVVDSIAKQATTTRAGHENVPVKPIYIKSAKRKTK
jgi:cyclophilin family peptidyl-prolyl cis-trans isomerase